MPIQKRCSIICRLHTVENITACGSLILIALFPTLEVIARKFFQTGIPSSTDYTRHLIIWVTFLGGAVTSREGKHLALSAGIAQIKGPLRKWIHTGSALVAATVCTGLLWSSLSLILIGFDPAVLVLIVFGLLGTPIFIVLGGIAYLLFAGAGGALEVIPSEAYTMLTGHSIPAIPLFILAGFILSESKAGKRLEVS